MNKPYKALRYLLSDNCRPKSPLEIRDIVGDSTAIGSLIADLRKSPWYCDIKCHFLGVNKKTNSRINLYELLSFSNYKGAI
jgi:hypothetical protein